MLDFIDLLWTRFPWRTIWSIPQRSEESVVEHAAILAAVAENDPERAAAEMAWHVSLSCAGAMQWRSRLTAGG
jgi:DNA-binding GntR family transcriptional regulator